MSFVSSISAQDATGLLKTHYDQIAAHVGRKDEPNNIIKGWSLQPEIAEAWIQWLRISQERSGLDRVTYECMECRIMYLLKCRFVLVNHCFILHNLSGWDHDKIKRVVHTPEGAGLDARQVAVIRFAEKTCLRSHEVGKADVQALLAHGFSEPQYVALVFTISALVSNAIYPNALGVELNEFSKAYRDIADW